MTKRSNAARRKAQQQQQQQQQQGNHAVARLPPPPQQHFSLTVTDTWPRFLRVSDDGLCKFRNAVKSVCPSPSSGDSRHERMHMREWQRAYNGLIDFARIIYEKGDFTLACNREVGARLFAELQEVCHGIEAYYDEYGDTDSDAYFGYDGDDEEDYENNGYGYGCGYGANYDDASSEYNDDDDDDDLDNRIQVAVEENVELVNRNVDSLRREVAQLRGEVAQLRSSQAQLVKVVSVLQRQLQQQQRPFGFATMPGF